MLPSDDFFHFRDISYISMKSNFLFIFFISLSVWIGIACSAKQNRNDAISTRETVSTGYAENATEISPLLTGMQIPSVPLRTIDGDTVQITDLTAQKPTVLIFYRGGWCPYCNRHLAELQKAEEKILEMGYQILAVSPDRPELLKKSVDEHDLSYSLYSDSPMEVSKAFGLAFRLDDQTFNRYRENGIDLTERSGYDHHLLPVPAVFLIDTNGKIQFQYVNPDYKTRIKSSVLLAAAKAYYPKSE